MSEKKATVTMAPREITDLVYRCCRVHGCEAGVAARTAANVTHAELHRGGGVEAFLHVVADGDVALSAFAQAPDLLEAGEVAGNSVIEFAASVAIAALSASLWQSAMRGYVAVSADATTSGSMMIDQLQVEADQLSAEEIAAASQRNQAAMQFGVAVDAVAFRSLEAHAAKFLVPESIVDKST